MNLAASAPVWLAWLLALALVAAAAEDAARLKISNVTSIIVLVLAFIAMAIAGSSLSLWQNAAIFGAILVVGTFLFSREILGGGDVKMLAAVGLWFDFDSALWLLICVTLSGGVLAILILTARMFMTKKTGNRIAVLNKNSGIPYGVAVAAGALITMALQRG